MTPKRTKARKPREISIDNYRLLTFGDGKAMIHLTLQPGPFQTRDARRAAKWLTDLAAWAESKEKGSK